MTNELAQAGLLLLAGLISGLLNSVAGGGSFVSFPALIMVGLLPIPANATSTLAVWPGTFATMFAYRKELATHTKKLPLFIFLSILGGLIGAVILLHISNNAFSAMVPYLLLAATILFTFRTKIFSCISKISPSYNSASKSTFYSAIMLILFIAIAIYGGFFGAGMGIMLLALFGLMGMKNIHEMNALRSCVGLCGNSIAIALFATSGIIMWKQAAIMAVGGIIGGYGGAHYALRLPQNYSRNAVIIIAWTMTIYFFWKQY
jgi:uncharacterized membrane protein YfcA